MDNSTQLSRTEVLKNRIHDMINLQLAMQQASRETICNAYKLHLSFMRNKPDADKGYIARAENYIAQSEK